MTDQQDKTPVNGGAGIIGVVGLGNAGSAIAAAFAALGVVHGYDQNAGRRDDAAGKGIITHDHLDGVASQADVIILSLPHPDISIAVTTQIMAQPIRPKLVIETSTVTPQTAIDCAALAAAKNVGFVDAAIAGGVASMATGQMTFFMGGDDAAKAMARPVLEPVAAGIYDLGNLGAGMGIKVVNNAVMHALMVVLIEAFAMSKKAWRSKRHADFDPEPRRRHASPAGSPCSREDEICRF